MCMFSKYICIYIFYIHIYVCVCIQSNNIMSDTYSTPVKKLSKYKTCVQHKDVFFNVVIA